MKNLVLASPGYRGRKFPAGADSDLLLLDPLNQASRIPAGTPFLTDKDGAPLENASSLDSLAKQFAAQWALHPEIENLLNFQEIRLGAVAYRSLVYFFTGVLHAAVLGQRVAASGKYSNVKILGDGSYWDRVLMLYSRQAGEISSSCRDRAPQRETRKPSGPQEAARRLSAFFYRILKHPPRQSAQRPVIFSSALRYYLPFMPHLKNSYFLREIFSVEAARLSLRNSFTHLVVPASADLPDPHGFRDKINRVISILDQASFFQFGGINLWPALRQDFAALIEREILPAAHWAGYFGKMLSAIAPSAVFFDEDVCTFNKTLALVCARDKVPTFCLLHGIPFFDIGFSPLSSSQVLVWGESSRRRLESWGIPEEKIRVTGAPQYESFPSIDRAAARRQVSRDFKLPSEGSLLLLATQPFHTNHSPDFFLSPLTPALIESALAALFVAVRKNPAVSLVVKLHPRDEHEAFTQALLARQTPDVQARVRLTRSYCTPELLGASDLVATTGSTVYFEALLLGVPVILLDHARARGFEFMGDRFLNLEEPEACGESLLAMLRPEKLAERLEEQSRETLYHFHGRNRNAVRNVLEILKAA